MRERSKAHVSACLCAGEDCQDLQHVRPSHVHRWWSCRQQLRCSGTSLLFFPPFPFPFFRFRCVVQVNEKLSIGFHKNAYLPSKGRNFSRYSSDLKTGSFFGLGVSSSRARKTEREFDVDGCECRNRDLRQFMQALRKEPMTVYGDGKQTRSFQYVSDLVSISPF